VARFSLPLPVADAAGPAGPDLDPGIEGLGIERVAMVTGDLRARHQPRLGASVCDARARSNHLGLGFRLSSHLRAVALLIDRYVTGPA
jgi:hypothetical protein